MSRRDDDGVEIDLPFLHFYAGGRGVHIGGRHGDEEIIDMEMDEQGEYRQVRQRVRRRLRFFRHAFTFVALNGIFVLLDWGTGGSGSGINWSQWVAGSWGVFLGWEFISIFVAPHLWGKDMEERLIQRELRRRRGG
ncbi:MAG: 2TM domain-containing protein [Chloroflexi bacterium]|nr:2TM domain-containing protein [Chloroflexota bacterium]